MNKPIIIDGVDVSECKNYTTMEDCDGIHDLCEELDDYCSIKKNCYFKQLQRAKAENEELKEQLNSYIDRYGAELIKSTVLKQALEKIYKIWNPKDKLIIHDCKQISDTQNILDEVLK